MSLFDSLLVEGSEAVASLSYMRELAAHIRMRRAIDLDTYGVHLAERGELGESHLWETIE